MSCFQNTSAKFDCANIVDGDQTYESGVLCSFGVDPESQTNEVNNSWEQQMLGNLPSQLVYYRMNPHSYSVEMEVLRKRRSQINEHWVKLSEEIPKKKGIQRDLQSAIEQKRNECVALQLEVRRTEDGLQRYCQEARHHTEELKQLEMEHTEAQDRLLQAQLDYFIKDRDRLSIMVAENNRNATIPEDLLQTINALANRVADTGIYVEHLSEKLKQVHNNAQGIDRDRKTSQGILQERRQRLVKAIYEKEDLEDQFRQVGKGITLLETELKNAVLRESTIIKETLKLNFVKNLLVAEEKEKLALQSLNLDRAQNV